MVVATRRFPPWSDLHPELLGLVLRRLPSLADRIRLRAVCRSWRRDALLEPLPPPLPWLTLPDGTFLSIPDGEIHRMPVPDDARLCHGSVGNWLFLSHNDDGCSLMNPFSRDVLQLPKVGNIWRRGSTGADDDHKFAVYLKPVALSPSRDPLLDSLFAMLIMDNKCDTVISICQPTTATAFRVPDHRCILDVAFYLGKLYGIARGSLFLLDAVSSYKKGMPARILSMKCVVNSVSMDDPGTAAQSFANKGYVCGYWGYLVESSGRLLYVRRLLGLPSSVPADTLIRIKHARTLSFDLFEADLTIDSDYGRWRRVKTLRGQALFVSPHSKSLPASEHGAREDCIYFMRDYDKGNLNADPLSDAGVFNMRNGTITPLLQDTAVVPPTQGGYGLPAWFFPGEAM